MYFIILSKSSYIWHSVNCWGYSSMQDTSHTFEIVHVISALALCELYGPFFI